MTEPSPFRPQINIGLPPSTPARHAAVNPPAVKDELEVSTKKYHTDPAVPGEPLNNFITRVPSEDGRYVKITKHIERIEMIKQPPTPEEIAEAKRKEGERKAEEKKFLRVVFGVLGGFLAMVFGLAWFDERQNQLRNQQERIEKTNKKLADLADGDGHPE